MDDEYMLIAEAFGLLEKNEKCLHFVFCPNRSTREQEARMDDEYMLRHPPHYWLVVSRKGALSRFVTKSQRDDNAMHRNDRIVPLKTLEYIQI